PRLGILLGWSLARMLVVVPSFLVAGGLILAFGGVPPALALLEAALVILVSALGSYGFAFLLVGLTLRLKDAESVVSLLGNSAPLLGGVFFPVFLLPQPLRSLSYLFPFTYGAELLRAAWFGSPTSLPKDAALALLAGLSVGYLLLGWLALRHLEKRARAHGLEGF
ncbi:MAG: ABC transporter permease, partial [Candidatus Bipolaricaulaceae bacterium]